MPKKQMPGQQSLDDYRLDQVDVRLVLKESSPLYSTQALSGPEQAAEIMAEALKDLDREWVCVVNMDNRLRPINYNVVSIGGLNQSLVPIQNVFKSSILSNAGSIMLFHTHPSGDITPSQEDINITRKLLEAGKFMDIPVVDHIIIGGGNGRQYSFRENQPELFNNILDFQFIDEMTKKGRVREMANEYKDVRNNERTGSEVQTMAGMFRNYEEAKKALFVRVRNADRSSEAVADAPHKNVEDLTMTYHLRVSASGNEVGSTMVTNEMLNHFGVSAEQLHEDAIRNSQEIFPAKIAPMATILFGVPEEEALMDGQMPMMVLTNQAQVYGASAMFYPDQMDRLAEKLEGNYFILPSSVHEIIAIPDDGTMAVKDLEQMVTDINASQVELKDQLSDHVYHFDAREHTFERASDYEARKRAEEQDRGKNSILKKLDEKKQEAGRTAGPVMHEQHKAKAAEAAL